MSTQKKHSLPVLAETILSEVPQGLFAELHNKAGKELETIAFPTTRDEAWRYTRISGLLRKSFRPVPEGNLSFDNKLKTLVSDHPVVFFANGHFANASGTKLPGVAHVLSQKGPAVIPPDMPEKITGETDAFGVLNKAGFTDGVVIDLPEETHTEKPLFIVNHAEGTETAATLRHFIRVGKNASASAVLLFTGKNEVFHNVFTSVHLEKGAQLRLITIHLEDTAAYTINTVLCDQLEGSVMRSGNYVFGGKLIRTNLFYNVKEPGCDTKINGAAIINGRQHADFRVVLDHQAPDCQSDQVFKNVVSDTATGVFNGKIFVRPDAQRINAFQTNKNMLLGETARAYARPQLEIYADDVKCSHGSTTGQLDKEALFYLMARGIPARKAAKMLVSAFAGETLDIIDDDSIRMFIEDLIHKKSGST